MAQRALGELSELSVTSQSLHTYRQALHRHHTRGQYVLQKDCLLSQHTRGAKSGPAPASVVEHRPIKGLKVVAPGLLEKRPNIAQGPELALLMQLFLNTGPNQG